MAHIVEVRMTPEGPGPSGDSSQKNQIQAAIRVVLIDSFRLFLECLVQSLGQDPLIRVVATASTEDDALQILKEYECEVVILGRGILRDLGRSVIKRFKEISSANHLIVIGLPEDADEIMYFIEAGIDGYLTENHSLEVLRESVRLVVNEETLCEPRLAHFLFLRMAELSERLQFQLEDECPLSAREIDVLTRLSLRLRNQEIADQLCISVHTVKNHVHNILKKLGASDRNRAISLARIHGWI